MKDLFVLTADADAKAVLDSVLLRTEVLGIRSISFEVSRHTGRDSGLVHTGPEFSRLKRKDFSKCLLIWDHHGSGWERKYPANKAVTLIRQRLAQVTWQNHSQAIVLEPELEEWLWHSVPSLCKHLKVSDKKLELWIKEFVKKHNIELKIVFQEDPKGLFEFICLEKLHRTISPRDFGEMAKIADLQHWKRSFSFLSLVNCLQSWFPPRDV